jgi:tRNA(Ile2) C34 agmatinyltransferase TiaS
MAKFIRMVNVFKFNEELRFEPVSPLATRLCPWCRKDMGTIDRTIDWRFCPHCGERILDRAIQTILGYEVSLWGNEFIE